LVFNFVSILVFVQVRGSCLGRKLDQSETAQFPRRSKVIHGRCSYKGEEAIFRHSLSQVKEF
jgi:hypothetical protein